MLSISYWKYLDWSVKESKKGIKHKFQIVSVNKIVLRHKNKNAIAEASGVVGLLVIIFDEQPLSPDTNPIVNVIKTGREQQQQQQHLQQQLHSVRPAWDKDMVLTSHLSLVMHCPYSEHCLH